MKKKVLMGIVLALIATSAAFAQQPTLDKLTFDLYSSGSYYQVRAVNRQVSGAVVIPGAYEGKPVVTHEKAFVDNPNITSVVMLNGVQEIWPGAFWNCTGLTSVTIPNSVTAIGVGAFQGCTRLTTVTIPPNVTRIQNNTFNSCTNLTSVTIPNTVTQIGGNAFQGCTSLTSVTIPASVRWIIGSAFRDCTSLTSVTIQASSMNMEDASVFPGDLYNKYRAASGGAGTYTRQRGSDVWTKQGAVSSIDGTWRRSDGTQFVISGTTGKDNSYATLSADGRTLTINGIGTFTKQ